jgi:pSer/pThr/pTyr-binding forkhead associated (FHA) protein
MSGKITLTVTQGSLKGQTFVFEKPTHCTIGRAKDCELSLVNEPGNHGVSRHHCELEIKPPQVCVRDLGSLHGTYVNGQKIGQRHTFLPPETTPYEGTKVRQLHPGDEIQVGPVAFSIGLDDPETR